MGVLSVARGRDAVGCVVGARGIKSHPRFGTAQNSFDLCGLFEWATAFLWVVAFLWAVRAMSSRKPPV